MKDTDIDEVLAKINKAYGKGTILRANEAKSLVVDRMSSGIFELDLRLGGGLPRDRFIVYKGGFSTGKTTVAMINTAAAQRSCRYCGQLFERVTSYGEVQDVDCKCGKREPMRCLWVDAEHSFDPEWAAKWGIDINEQVITLAEFAEQAIDIMDAAIRSRQFDFIVLDSIAALTPQIEMTEAAGTQQIGAQARLVNKALRKWTSSLNSGGLNSDTKCTIVMINQERVGIGGFRPTVTSPGGKGVDFYESVEIRFKREGFITEEGTDRPIGLDVSFVSKKNKTAPMSQPGQLSLYTVTGNGYIVGTTDTEVQVLRHAIFWELVTKGGSWITFKDGTKLQGLVGAANHLRENTDLFWELHDAVLSKEKVWANKGMEHYEDDRETES